MGRIILFAAARDLQHGQERFLGNIHAANALHAFFAFFLFFKQLAFTRDVSAITLCQHILAHRGDGFARDHAAADGSLDRHFEHLARD